MTTGMASSLRLHDCFLLYTMPRHLPTRLDSRVAALSEMWRSRSCFRPELGAEMRRGALLFIRCGGMVLLFVRAYGIYSCAAGSRQSKLRGASPGTSLGLLRAIAPDCSGLSLPVIGDGEMGSPCGESPPRGRRQKNVIIIHL